MASSSGVRLMRRGTSYWAYGSPDSEKDWPCTLKVEVSNTGRERGMLYMPLLIASSAERIWTAGAGVACEACSGARIVRGTL